MKSRSAIKLGVLLLVFLVIAYIGVIGISFGVYDILPFATQVNKAADVSEGSVIYVKPTEVGLQDADVEEKTLASLDVIRQRLELYGLNAATVSQYGIGARVVLPVSDVSRIENTEYYVEDVADYITAPGKLEIFDEENNLVFDQSHIVDGTAYVNSESKIVVQVLLDEEGTEILKQATENHLGENFTTRWDGLTVGTVTQSVVIANGVYSFTGLSTRDAAIRLLNQVRSGVMPAELHAASTMTTTAELGSSTLYDCYQALWIVALVVMVALLFLFRLPGIISAFTIACYMLLVMFVTALFDFEISMSAIIAFVIGFVVCTGINAVMCMKIRADVAKKGVLASTCKASMDALEPMLIDVHVILIVFSFILLCFEQSVLRSFGIGLLIASAVSFLLCALLPRFMIKQFIGLNARKPWLYGMKGGIVNE